MEAIVHIRFETKQCDFLNKNIISLIKRTSQLKASVTNGSEVCQHNVQTPTKKIKLKVIGTQDCYCQKDLC